MFRFIYNLVPHNEKGEVDGFWTTTIGFTGAFFGWLQNFFHLTIAPAYSHVATTIHCTAILGLWFINMIVGWMSDAKSHKVGWRVWKAFSGSKAFDGMEKLVRLWVPYMFVCYVLQTSDIMGGPMFAGSLELYAVAALSRKILRNLAHSNGDEEMEKAVASGDIGKIINLGFKRAEEDRNKQTEMITDAVANKIEEAKTDIKTDLGATLEIELKVVKEDAEPGLHR
jgi:hypothetical protein